MSRELLPSARLEATRHTPHPVGKGRGVPPIHRETKTACQSNGMLVGSLSRVPEWGFLTLPVFARRTPIPGGGMRSASTPRQDAAEQHDTCYYQDSKLPTRRSFPLIAHIPRDYEKVA